MWSILRPCIKESSVSALYWDMDHWLYPLIFFCYSITDRKPQALVVRNPSNSQYCVLCMSFSTTTHRSPWKLLSLALLLQHQVQRVTRNWLSCLSSKWPQRESLSGPQTLGSLSLKMRTSGTRSRTLSITWVRAALSQIVWNILDGLFLFHPADPQMIK